MNSITPLVVAQQWIKEMPGYERYKKMSQQIRSSVEQGRISTIWAKAGKLFTYNLNKKKFQFDIKKIKAVGLGEVEKEDSSIERYRRMYANRPAHSR